MVWIVRIAFLAACIILGAIMFDYTFYGGMGMHEFLEDRALRKLNDDDME